MEMGKVIDVPIDSLEQEMDVKMDELIKQNLTDVKTAQIAYKEVNGAYAKDFDALKDFIVNGKIKFVVKTVIFIEFIKLLYIESISSAEFPL